MFRAIEFVANIAGVAGILLCLASGAVRVTGEYYVAGFEAMTLFVSGVGLMVFACLLKLELLARASRDIR